MSTTKKKTTSKPDCARCPALCCHGLTIDMNKPRTQDEIDELKWKLNYEDVGAYVLNKRWYLFMDARCGYLDDNDLCTIYERRYDICRRHNPPDCERFMEWYDDFFETPEELVAYLEKEKRRIKRRRLRKLKSA